MLYKKLLRPLFFRCDSERIHDFMIGVLSRTGPFLGAFRHIMTVKDPALEQTLWQMRFPNPVGLAAGFDKNAEALKAWPALGFGFAEAGTITAREQAGNPKPRIFRLIPDEALINRCGFNNAGADAAAAHIGKMRLPAGFPIGINIGKSKVTALDKAHEDYLYSFRRLWACGNYFAVNVSSPNTPELRALQEKPRLRELLQSLMTENHHCSHDQNIPLKPILVKMAPDLTRPQIDDVIDVALETGIQGIIVSNTTIRRDFILSSKSALTEETGGLSGKPLKNLSTELIRYVYQACRKKLVVIGAGGIQTGEDAFEKIAAGASLVQIYTGLVYEGPFICRKINTRLLRLLNEKGFKNISEAVGHENP